jgi:hypothetical protein
MQCLSGQNGVVIGTTGWITEHIDPGQITESLGVIDLTGCDHDAVAKMEYSTHACAGHEQGSTQNPIGFGDLSVKVRLAAFDGWRWRVHR